MFRLRATIAHRSFVDICEDEVIVEGTATVRILLVGKLNLEATTDLL